MYAAAGSELERQVAAVWSQVLGIAPIGIDDNFFELGGNSLVGLTVVARLRKTLTLEKLPAQVLYEAPTVAALARYIAQDGHGGEMADILDAVRAREGVRRDANRRSRRRTRPRWRLWGWRAGSRARPTSGRSGTTSPRGVCSIRGFSDDELVSRGVDRALLHQPNYVKSGTVLENVDRFDAHFSAARRGKRK